MNTSKFLMQLVASFLVITACAQEEPVKNSTPTEQETKKVAETRHHEPHQYGGWYCPDNLFGFPPVNIHQLDKVPAISNRLPTEAEVQTEASLIFVDTEKYPDAQAINMDLPRVARIYSEYSKMEELVIVIQAVAIGEDSIVGYRFPSGGNGSAWLDQVTFLTDAEIIGTEDGPFVFEKTELTANTSEIWKALSGTEYAQRIGKRFQAEDFFAAEWTSHSMKHLEYETIGEKAQGMIGNVFGNLYLQIDYDLNGFHFTEKILVLENRETNRSEVLVVAGPYRVEFTSNQNIWKDWLKEVEYKSEVQ